MPVNGPVNERVPLPLRRALTDVRGGGFNPSSLFAGGAQGVLYDFTDAATLFQDSAGTTAIAAGTGIGLVLDRSKGLVRGVERFADPSFDSTFGASSWQQNVVSATTSISGGALRFNAAPNAYGAYQDKAEIGKWYEFTMEVESVGAGSVGVQANGALAFSTTTAGTARFVFLASAAQIVVRANGTTTAVVTSASLRELPGNHATQTATASKPLWQTTYGTYDGFDDFLVTPSIDFTGTDKVTVVAGVYKASDAAAAILTELSVDSGANAGAFALFAPGAAAANFAARSAGTLISDVARAGFASPFTAVLSHSAEIGTDTNSLRVNGAAGSIATDQGTGNYGNHPLYIGRRAGSSLPFNGRIHRLLIIGRALTAAELAQAERWAAQPTGVTLP